MNDLQLQILVVITAAILLTVRAYMISQERNKIEQNELNNLK
jgi:hypothetical protein